MARTGSEAAPRRKKGSGPAFRREDPVENQSRTTRENINAATVSRSCLVASRIGSGLQHAMVDV